MQSTVLSSLIDTLTPEERQALLSDARLRTLPAVFAAIPDPRSRQGRRYALSFLLTCVVAALLCNCNTLASVGQWCHDHEGLLRRVFPHHRFLTPTGALLRWLLPRLSVSELEWAIASWVQQTRPLRDREPVGFDGKTVCGAATGDGRAPHLLSLSTHTTGETLVQVRVDEKTNEIPVARAILPYLRLRGRAITADALHTNAQTAQTILDQHADYLLVVKRNQPTLYDECAAFFSDPTARVRRTTTIDRRRGRTETRTLYATTQLNLHLMRYSSFPHIRQVACLRTVTVDATGTHEDVRFLLTSLAPRHADPDRLLTLARGHWSIESRHYTRDVTFGEDRSSVRTGHAPQIMASLRNLALTLIHRSGTSEIASYRRHLAAHPTQALRLLVPRTHSRR
jgi:predicted transposase YbfD/YdcC